MNSKPIHEIRLGKVKAAIWENAVGDSTRLNTTFLKVYRIKEEDRVPGDNGWRETTCFGREDLPLLMKLADQAHTFCYDYRKQLAA